MPPYTPSPPRRSKAKILILVISVLLFLSLVAASILVLTTPDATGERAKGFVSSLTNKRYAEAYNYFSSSLKESTTLGAFKQAFEPIVFDKPCQLEVDSITSNSETSKQVNGFIVCGEDSYAIEFEFIKTGEDEKIESYNIQSPVN